MTAKQFLDSLTKEQRCCFFACVVKLFDDDAARFAKAAGISVSRHIQTIDARKSFL
jgi:hypothetical protein